MPIQEDKKYFDFEEIFFEKNCNIDLIINTFFMKYQEIKGDKEFITYKIKNVIETDRKFLNGLNNKGSNTSKLMLIGKVTYLKHYVIPKKNNGKEYYIYCINSFI